MRIQHLNHSTYQHEYHIVWGTRFKIKFIKDYVKQELRKNLYETIKKYPTLGIISFGSDKDHIHVQIEIPPDLSVAAVVRIIKSKSSLALKKRFKFIREMYLDGSVWSVGYFSSTIGIDEDKIQKYIEWQGKRDFPEQLDLEFE